MVTICLISTAFMLDGITKNAREATLDVRVSVYRLFHRLEGIPLVVESIGNYCQCQEYVDREVRGIFGCPIFAANRERTAFLSKIRRVVARSCGPRSSIRDFRKKSTLSTPTWPYFVFKKKKKEGEKKKNNEYNIRFFSHTFLRNLDILSPCSHGVTTSRL